MLSKFKTFSIFAFLSVSPALVAGESLFTYKGKAYTKEQMTIKQQFRLFDLENHIYNGKKNLIEDAILDMHIEEVAKKSGKSAAEARKKVLAVKDPTDADLKKFYEENKSKIPYPFEKVKGEVARFVKQKAAQEQRGKVLAELKKKGTYKISFKGPVSPEVKINTKNFARRGKANSKVTVVEFADYKCPHCREASLAFKKLYKKYDSKVNFVFIDFPISHGISTTIAAGAYCAGKQGKYWEYHTMAFDQQKSLNANSHNAFAEKLGLDLTKFKKCGSSKEGAKVVSAGKKEGERVGVSGTPTIFINGRKVTKGYDFETMSQEIDAALSGRKSS